MPCASAATIGTRTDADRKATARAQALRRVLTFLNPYLFGYPGNNVGIYCNQVQCAFIDRLDESRRCTCYLMAREGFVPECSRSVVQPIRVPPTSRLAQQSAEVTS